MFSAGLTSYGTECSRAWIEWMLCDDSRMIGHEKWFNYRNSTALYVLTAYVLTREGLWATIWWLAVRVMVATICTAMAIGILAVSTPWSPRLVVAAVFIATISAIVAVAEWYPVLEAVLLDHVPKMAQRAWSRRYGKPYRYRPLREGEIRLLVLKRTRLLFPSMITARIVHVPGFAQGEGVPIYEAVSYRWGSPECTDEIILDGARFAVTQSAFELLLARRSIWRERTIWIDAICIDQSNQEEKSEQVQVMWDIYSRAARVIVFPGGGWQDRLACTELVSRLPHPQIQNEGSPLERYSPKWRAMIDLLVREYFNRVWIIQEVVAGQRVELYCGGYYLQWEDLFQVAVHLWTSDRRDYLTQTEDVRWQQRLDFTTLDQISEISLLRQAKHLSDQSFHEQDLGDILFATRKCNASDPRDNVFALLGLARRSFANSGIKPDYTKPTEQVFEDVARSLFLGKENPSLHLLACAGTGFSSGRMLIASWIPDFSEKREIWYYSNPVSRDSRLPPPFSASGATTARTREGHLSRTLTTAGILVDKVFALSTAGALNYGFQQRERFVRDVARHKFTFARKAMELIVENPNLWSLDTNVAFQHLWRALVADCIERRSPAGLEFQRAFSSWFDFMKFLTETDISELFPPTDSYLLKRLEYEGNQGRLYDSSMGQACYGRCFAVAETGRLCLVPPLSRVGDSVFIPFGVQTPFLIRKKPGSKSQASTYELIGEAYVQGVMHGEAVANPSSRETIIVLA